MLKYESSRLSMREAAEFFGHSYSWIWSNHQTIGLNGYRIGGRWFFDLQDLQDWEAAQKSRKFQTHGSKLNQNQKRGRIQFA